jgi:osmotically-inducible protein OsmY
MASVKAFCATVIVLILVGVSGCAEFRKCGPEGCPSDQKITANVQTRLNQHPEFGPPDSIEVQTLDHVVYLNGLVDVGLERRTAESIAKQVPGVERVVNNIAVQR